MKLMVVVAAVLVAACGSVQANDENKQTVLIYMVNQSLVPVEIRKTGEAVAAQMFAEIGVHLVWRFRQPAAGQAQREHAIVIEIATKRPRDVSVNSLASAQPFEGSAIAIYYQALKWAERDIRMARQLYAHVMAHEIGHILQQTATHSRTGIMKATWTGNDYSLMRLASLHFEPRDVEAIHAGLDERNARSPTLTSAK
jgi:hypothetical protein